jgi:2-dehydro-3-deoxygluconokinase
MGVPSRLVGRVGEDSLGAALLASWDRAGVDVRFIRRDPDAPTGLYVSEPTPKEGHHYTYWRRGSAGSRLEPGDIDAAFLSDLGVLLISGVTLAISPSAAAAAEDIMARAQIGGVRTALVLNHRARLDGDPQRLAATAARSDVVLASAEDCEAVFGTDDPASVRDALGPCPTELVITDGARPALLSADDTVVRQPVPSVPVASAGGAGDALAGAYLAARLLAEPARSALSLGVAAATLSVQREGCADSYPEAETVRAVATELPPQSRERVVSRAPM